MSDRVNVRSSAGSTTTATEREIASQPDCWERAVDLAEKSLPTLPQSGERVAVLGCGTSLAIAQAYARWREDAGHGESDVFSPADLPQRRQYDQILVITRSGTTTEVLDVLGRLPATQRSTAITADRRSPVGELASQTIALTFADEQSLVQTRFATSTLTLLRHSVGHQLSPVIADGRQALGATLPAPAEFRQFTFLGSGPAAALATEAALKMRETALAWTESYACLEYRHGPIAIADERSLVWILGEAPDGLIAQIQDTGAVVECSGKVDPLAELVRIQRFAVSLALQAGINPDRPRQLSRSVILSPAH